MRQHRRIRMFLTLFALAVATTVVAGCGSGDEGGSSGGSKGNANEVDRAFVRLMVPHHESAVEMANIAAEKGQHKEIKTLAGNITSSQNAEIEQMKGISTEIGADADGGSKSGMDHGGGEMPEEADDLKSLGLSREEAGMSMDMQALETAKPFDRAFIDAMVPHHESAVMMAKAELAKGKNPELKTLAQNIIDAQEKEIEEMNSWRTDWYGGPVPATQ